MASPDPADYPLHGAPHDYSHFKQWSARYRLRSLTDAYSEMTSVNESDLSALIRENPEVLCPILETREVLQLRKEVTWEDGSRADFVVHFYGRSSADIIEVKSPGLPLLTQRGELTLRAKSALTQLRRYREQLRARRRGASPEDSADAECRMVLVGMRRGERFRRHDVYEAVARAGFSEDAFTGRLLVISTEDLMDDVAELTHRTASDLLSSGHMRRALARGLARSAVGASLRKGVRSKLGDLLGRLQPHAIARYVGPAAAEHLPSSTFEQAATFAEQFVRKLDELPAMRRLNLSQPGVGDWRLASGAQMLADIMLYEQDGDVPLGKWRHGATYPAVDLLRQDDCSTTCRRAVADGIHRIVASDNSEDVIGAATHIARSLVHQLNGSDTSTAIDLWRRRWMAEQLTDVSKRGTLAACEHVQYVLALMGDSDAADALNTSVMDAQTRLDLTRWNFLHSRLNPSALAASLRVKARSSNVMLKRLAPFHSHLSSELQLMIDDGSRASSQPVAE